MCILSDALGTELAQRLRVAKGGTSIYVPLKLKPQHWLISLLGSSATNALMEAVGHGWLYVPKGSQGQRQRRDEHIYRDSFSLSRAELARKYDIGERQVYRILEKKRQEAYATALEGRPVAA